MEHLRRLGHVRERMRPRQTLLHHLPGLHQIGAGLECHLDRRQPGHRLGAHDLEPRDADQQVRLEGNGDQLFDFYRGEPERFGLDLHGWRGNLGEDIHGYVVKLGNADYHDQSGDRDHDGSPPHARLNN